MTFLNLFFKFNSSCDVAEPWQFGIQDPATPNAEGMLFFHNYLNLFSIFIGLTVFYLLYCIFVDYNSKSNPKASKFSHSSALEIIWTIIPAFILILIAIPSFSLLYSLDDLVDPNITLKVVGHQWYWSYEYSDFNNETIEFESRMLGVEDMPKNDQGQSFGFRLLEVDNRVILPVQTHIRVLITADDVLHSWAIPSFGIKVDACPGRLSQASLFIQREGVYYGQCSEICGINHGFMPIVVSGVSVKDFIKSINSKLDSELIEE